MEQSNTEDRYMLTSAELVRLERQTRDRTILSVYLNGEGSDSVSRARWQADLRHSLDDIASWFRDASHQEREDFAARRRLLEERVEQFRGEIGAPGWVAFLDEEGIQHQSEVFAPVPTMAVWSTGASVAPYIRALKESHPVIVAVVDSRHARLYRYVENGLEQLERIEADTDFEVVGNMSKRAAQGAHTGRRGKTGTDAGQVALQQATERMLSDAVSRIETLAHDAAWIAIGGIPVVATAALSLLTPAAASRSLRAELDVHATDAQDNQLWNLAPDGTLTPLPLSATIVNMRALAYDSQENMIYTLRTSSPLSLYRIDPADGTVTLIADGFRTFGDGNLEIDVAARTLYVADSGDNQIYSICLPSNVSIDPPVALREGVALAMRPNPAIADARITFTLPGAAAVRIDVVDVAGRKVRELAAGTMPAGAHSLIWNGLDDSGRRVGSGVYFVRLHGDRIEETLRIVRLR
jgi:hypothetical protein